MTAIRVRFSNRERIMKTNIGLPHLGPQRNGGLPRAMSAPIPIRHAPHAGDNRLGCLIGSGGSESAAPWYIPFRLEPLARVISACRNGNHREITE
jgi:hypothetical protein